MSSQKEYPTSICNWPHHDRPRERLVKYGEHTLTISELLAILLRTGVRGRSALDLSHEIIRRFPTLRKMAQADMAQWLAIKGLGIAKVTQIRAALEIGRRYQEEAFTEDRVKITSSQQAVQALMPQMRDLQMEVFKVIYLNAQNRLIEIIEEERGTVNHAHPIIREIFHRAFRLHAVSIICAHNHPSGSIEPSSQDRQFTRRLTEAGEMLNVKVLDHLIIGRDRHFSFADQHLL